MSTVACPLDAIVLIPSTTETDTVMSSAQAERIQLLSRRVLAELQLISTTYTRLDAVIDVVHATDQRSTKIATLVCGLLCRSENYLAQKNQLDNPEKLTEDDITSFLRPGMKFLVIVCKYELEIPARLAHSCVGQLGPPLQEGSAIILMPGKEGHSVMHWNGYELGRYLK